MRFAALEYAQCLWLVAGILLTAVVFSRRREALLRSFAAPAVLAALTAGLDRRARMFKQILIVLSLVLGVMALMRPQWGFQWHEVTRRGLDIMIALDTSKSMLAADVRPNRLMRSKLAVQDLLKKLTGDRIGLIAFSGTAFVQCPLTVDYNGFLLSLHDVTTASIPRGGTAITSAIDTAIRTGFAGGIDKYKVLVIITDGEDLEGDVEEAARRAQQAGIKIFCAGVGTPEGELIQVADGKGGKIFLKDNQGHYVKSRLNEDLLQRIAFITGGSYVRSSGAAFGLDYLYEHFLSAMEKKDIDTQMNKYYYERFQLPLAVAVLLLLLERFIRERKEP